VTKREKQKEETYQRKVNERNKENARRGALNPPKRLLKPLQRPKPRPKTVPKENIVQKWKREHGLEYYKNCPQSLDFVLIEKA
jgi:hypothetical protein